MSRSEFDNAGSHVAIKDLEGETLLITPIEYLEEVATSFGTKDAVSCDVVVLHDDGTFTEHPETLIFQGALIGALKRRISKRNGLDRDPNSGVVTETVTTTVRRVLGVLAKGEAKKGQSAPFILNSATDDQVALANAYVAKYPAPAPVTRVVRQYIENAQVVVNQPAASQSAPAAASASPVTTPAPVTTPEADPFAGGEDPFAV